MNVFKIAFILMALSVEIVSAATVETDVYERAFRRQRRNRPRHSTVLVRRELTDLKNTTHLEGEYFKIVLEKSNNPIAFSDEANLVKKAATVYHHLTIARNYWVNEMNSAYARSLPQITVRLEITAKYSELGHYMNENLEPEYNNAVSIEAGSTPSFVVPGETWGKEIWYRPMKRIQNQRRGTGEHPFSPSMETVARTGDEYVQSNMIYQTINYLFYDTMTRAQYGETVIRNVGTVAILHLIALFSRALDPLFMTRYYYLDTAMVPEVTYHEYSHLVLSDHLEISHSTPVIEGMADYFATLIAGTETMYEEVRGFSNNIKKMARNRDVYNPMLEYNEQSSSDFTLSLLWSIKDVLADDANQVIYNARTHLVNGESRIYNELPWAILRSCRQGCSNYMSQSLGIMRALENRGL